MRRAVSILVGAVVSALAFPASAQSTDHVRVHLVSDDDVFLQRTENRKWIDVCQSPCDRLVDADVRYRIDGPGVRPSRAFTLHATSLEGSETVEVDPSHDAARDVGFVLVGVGAAGALAGIFMASMGVQMESCDGAINTNCEAAHARLLRIGVATLVGSALVAGVGALISVRSSHSSVSQMASTSPKPKVRFFAGPNPVRRESGPLGGMGVADPTAIVAPIVSVAF